MAADNLDNVIAGAIADAREGGLVGETDGMDEELIEANGGDEDADTGDGEESEETPESAGDGDGEDEESEAEGSEDEEAEGEEADEEDEAEAESLSYDDALLKELGLAKDANGKIRWTSPVPLSKVKALVQARESAAVSPVLATIAKVYGVKPDQVTMENVEENLGYTVNLVKELRARTETYDALEPLMNSKKPEDVQKFVNALVKMNPLIGEALGGAPAKEKKTQPSPDNDPEPQPDKVVKIGDQEVPQYSKAQWEKREAWLRRQITREVMAEAEEAFGSRLKPFEEMVENSQRQQETQQQLKDRIDDLMTEARSWDGFEDNEEAIQDAFVALSKKNPSLSFEKVMTRAYHQVVIGALRKSKQKVREEVREENRKAPKATSVAAGGKKKVTNAGSGVGDGEDRTTSIIRQQIAKARQSGVIK